ncbi:hypothetical protein Y032_0471g2048 [Ancylostoma ceylanicum]|uniref:Secreted protein n=1 Tax=Ancylostoma ceylanicum TaxID=53326 RepID=A0A016WWU2_9BILA|nr:hypothetical protein Y032_0471g2048 [Ancylostoma ceylanicum]
MSLPLHLIALFFYQSVSSSLTLYRFVKSKSSLCQRLECQKITVLRSFHVGIQYCNVLGSCRTVSVTLLNPPEVLSCNGLIPLRLQS